ncbi:MAG: hypothetical protein QG658_439 [Patescibacteria group bacterium]|nr:hypothetical protein [Patescibacteria group bacterium]
MDALRTILSWLALIMLWAAPFIAKKQGKQLWLSGFIWKYALYFLGMIILQSLLIFTFGAAVGVLGSDPGYEVLYAALAVFAAAEIAIVGWLIFRQR